MEPEPTDLEGTLLANAEHLVQGRTEQDVLYELLLKLGFDLCVPIEKRQIAGKGVHSIGGGALIVCLTEGLTKDVVEALANGIVASQARQRARGCIQRLPASCPLTIALPHSATV